MRNGLLFPDRLLQSSRIGWIFAWLILVLPGSGRPAVLAAAGETQRLAEVRHVEGFYPFWSDLLARHPRLLIDNCCGGGEPIWKPAAALSRSGGATSTTSAIFVFLRTF